MALTLPYPDMDFVPLDILTALELDQMVANIEYIANDAFPVTNANIADSAVSTTKLNNNAVATAKIQDGAITGAKIASTAFALPVYLGKVDFNKRTYNNASFVLENKTDFYRATGVSTAISSSTNLVITLPTTGTYVARVRTSLWTGQNSWDYMLIETKKGGATFARAMCPRIVGSWGYMSCEGFVTIANGNNLSCYLNTNGNNFTEGNMSSSDSYMMVEIFKVS